MGTVVTPWGVTVPITTSTTPQMGKVTRYNVSAGAYSVTLPPLSSLSIGARTIIEKDRLDGSANLVTVNRTGTDTFDDGTTSFTVAVAGAQEELQVVEVGGIRYWKRFSGGASAGGGVTLAGVETLSNKTLTAPKIANGGFLADANGNEQIVFNTSTSAVNEIEVINAPTGSAPIIAARGGDTNVDLNFNGKGTGRVFCSGFRVVTVSEVQTLTNKRITQRVVTITSSATPAINTDATDVFVITAQAANITSMTSGLTGTPLEGDLLWIAITGTAARTIAWGAKFVGSTVALPTTTVGTARIDVGLMYDLTNLVWRCVAVA